MIGYILNANVLDNIKGIEYEIFSFTNKWDELKCHFNLKYYILSYRRGTIYQPLRSGRIWHKVNFLSGV